MAKLETKIYDARISDLTETEHNPRQISKTDFDKLKKSLKEFPEMLEIREVVIDENNVILGGHQRVRAAKANGESTITVKQVFGLTEKQKREFIIKDNIANGDWDLDEIANTWDDIPFDDWGADIKWADEPEPVAPDEEPTEVDEKNEPKSERGKIYRLGNHFLMCGDSTSSVDVAELMSGNHADIAFTSPPYGASKSANLRNHFEKGKKVEKIESFYETHDDNIDDWGKLFTTTLDFMLEYAGDVFVNVQMLSDNKKILWQSINERIDNLCDVLIWDKHAAAPQMANNVLNNRFEFILYMSKVNNSRALKFGNFHGTYSNVIDDVSRGTNEYADIHKAVFPVDLPMKIINMESKCNKVLELFCGTGSTIIACEELGKQCFAMEIDPRYCDVARKRWVKLVNGNDDDWEELTPEVERS